MPHMPTLPLHHGCAASHSTASYPSSVSASVYSSSATPGELPVPRTSRRQSANPRAASHSPNAVSQLRRQLSLPYGIISRIDGEALVRAQSGRAADAGSHRLADSSSPSRTGIRTSQRTSWSNAGWLVGRRRGHPAHDIGAGRRSGAAERSREEVDEAGLVGHGHLDDRARVVHARDEPELRAGRRPRPARRRAAPPRSAGEQRVRGRRGRSRAADPRSSGSRAAGSSRSGRRPRRPSP